VSFCGQQQPKCERAIRLAYPPFSCRFLSSSIPTNKNVRVKFEQLSLGNRPELDKCSNEIFSHNDGHYQLPKYSPFFMNHSVYEDLSLISTVSLSESFDFGNEMRILQNHMSLHYFVCNILSVLKPVTVILCFE
jgi:hypothetical protein